MSAYLKASKGSSSSNKCLETSSHETETTRSITYASEDLSIFSKGQDQASKSTLLNNSSSIIGGTGDIEFGSGADFSNAFEDTAFEKDFFDAIGRSDRSAKSSKLSRSCRNLKTSSEDDIHKSPTKKVSQSMRNLNIPKPACFDPFSMDDAFGADPFKDIDEGFATFGEGGDAMFGGGDAFQRPLKKPESRTKQGKSNSGAESRKPSSERRLRKPRDDAPESPSKKGSTPRGATRKKSSSTKETASIPPGKGNEQQKKFEKGDDHSNGADAHKYTRRSRRDIMTACPPNPDNAGVEGGGQAHTRRPRRGSVEYSNSDNALESANKSTPARQKSAPSPALRPSGGRRQRRASLVQSVEELAFMRTAGDAKLGKQPETWEDERALSQEKIIEMTRSGGGNRKDGKKESSIRDMAKILAMIENGTEEEKFGKDNRRSKSRSKRISKKEKGEEAETEVAGEACKMRRDRSRGSLVDRIAGHDSFEGETNSGRRDKGSDSGGLSYSDKVMRASQRLAVLNL